jgi:TPR repeat protein
MEIVRKAEARDLSAQVELGMIYLKGNLGITQDIERAVVWLLLAANGGSAEAQYYAGTVPLQW